jgi:hypothetical protein
MRAARARRPLVLILVAASHPGRRSAGLMGYTAEIFAALSACVREVDFIGWYRDNVIASAVLAVGDTLSPTVGRTLRARFETALRQRLSPQGVALFRVRVIELKP